MFKNVPANPHLALQEYFEEKDAKEAREGGMSLLEKAEEIAENVVDSVKDEAEYIICKMCGKHPHHCRKEEHVQRTNDVLPDQKTQRKLEKVLPSKEEVERMEQEFLQQ
ncbi:hypothetical protein DdX_12236 [Ditylenchus destructor]|uniref:Uncharacterized protein n=1 Tax=Ditylenchus destructor TaxID=166010 RepID=A0AAD4R3T3_9BILA|nr:hypothetical protein DdX_12236 [Ditylenchus destructor]